MKHNLLLGLAGILACSVLAACYPSVADLAPATPDKPWRPAEDKSLLEAMTSTPSQDDHAVSKNADTQSGTAPKFDLPSDSALPYKHDEVPVDSGHIYSLPELIDLAERSNPDTRIAWEQSRQAAFGVGLAQATYLPQLTGEILGGQEHTPLPIPKSLVSRGYFTADTDEILPSLVIKWLLFDFGKRDAEVEAAKQASFAANIAFTGAHQKLIFEVSKAYFALDAERAQLHVAEDAVKSAKILVDAADAKKKSGLGTVTDDVVSQQREAKARFELEHAKAVDNDAYHSLLEAMGLTPTLKLRIADSAGRTLPKSLAEDVDTYIHRALSKRPDILAALAKLRASEADISGAKASYYPTLGFEGIVNQNIGSASVDGGPTYRVNEPATAILLKLSLPLYDGGTRENMLGIARSKNAAAKEELSKAQDSAIRQVARAYDTVKSALAEYNAALALVKASNTAYSASFDSYRNGVGTFTTAVTAETEKAQAQSAQANAYASVLTAAAALAFSTGELTSTDALNNQP